MFEGVNAQVMHRLKSLSPSARSALVRAMVRRKYTNGDFIYLEHDEASHLFFVLAGFVRLSCLMEDGSAVIHSVLPPGESFGELGVFEGTTYAEMATAVGPLAVGCIPTSTFRLLCGQHPELLQILGQMVAKRYRAYIQLTRDLSFKTLSARLAQAVLRLADSLDLVTLHAGREVRYIGPLITQTDLSLMARGSRGNVNRALKLWERKGWIAMRDRSILVIERRHIETISLEEGL